MAKLEIRRRPLDRYADLLQKLQDTDAYVSKHAYEQFLNYQTSAVPFLLKSLSQSQIPQLRGLLFSLLGNIRDPECLPQLLIEARKSYFGLYLQDADKVSEMLDIIECLGAFSDPACVRLLGSISDLPLPSIQIQALNAMQNQGGKHHLPHIRQHLKSSFSPVRRRAQEVLAKLQPEVRVSKESIKV